MHQRVIATQAAPRYFF